MALPQRPAAPDTAGEVGWARGMKAGPEEGTWEQYPCGRDGTHHILKKAWKGLGDELDVETDAIYPGRTKHLSLFLSSLGDRRRRMMPWERLSSTVWGSERAPQSVF